MRTPAAPAIFDHPERFFYDDQLASPGCARTPACRATTRTIREIASRGRKVGTRFLCCTPSEFLVIPPDFIRLGLYAVATFDLDQYPDFDAVLEAARTLTEKRGRVNREIARAERLGYYADYFAPTDYAEDMVAIHGSKTVRDGRPVEGSYYQRSAAEIARADSRRNPCPYHHHSHWGVFQTSQDGGRDRLVAYVAAARVGACAWYNMIMGHGDHLRHGVMYLLHYRLIAELMRDRPLGLRFLTYFTFMRRPDDPASHWKFLALFKPVYFHYLDDRPVVMPARPAMPSFAEALLTIKETVGLPWPAALARAKELGIGEEWLAFLHRLWVIQQGRAPGLFNRVVRAGPTPGAELLRPVAATTFPVEALEGVANAAVLLHGHGRGLDCLLPMKDRDVAVAVGHRDPEELEVLRAMYPPQWHYAAAAVGMDGSADAQLLVVDCNVAENLGPFLKTNPRVLVAAAGAWDADAFALDLTALTGVKYSRRARYFRHGHPDEQFWFWFEPG
jgi:hypothetical protein